MSASSSILPSEDQQPTVEPVQTCLNELLSIFLAIPNGQVVGDAEWQELFSQQNRLKEITQDPHNPISNVNEFLKKIIAFKNTYYANKNSSTTKSLIELLPTNRKALRKLQSTILRLRDIRWQSFSHVADTVDGMLDLLYQKITEKLELLKTDADSRLNIPTADIKFSGVKCQSKKPLLHPYKIHKAIENDNAIIATKEFIRFGNSLISMFGNKPKLDKVLTQLYTQFQYHIANPQRLKILAEIIDNYGSIKEQEAFFVGINIWNLLLTKPDAKITQLIEKITVIQPPRELKKEKLETKPDNLLLSAEDRASYQKIITALIKDINELPPKSQLSDGTWLDLLKAHQSAESTPRGPVLIVANFLKKLEMTIIEITGVKGADFLQEILIQLLPENPELYYLKNKLARLADIISHSVYASEIPDYCLTSLYNVVIKKFEESKVKAQDIPEEKEDKKDHQINFIPTQGPATQDTEVLQSYKVTYALERNNIEAVFSGLEEFGATKNNLNNEKNILEKISVPAGAVSMQALGQLNAIWQAKPAGFKNANFEAGLESWTKLTAILVEKKNAENEVFYASMRIRDKNQLPKPSAQQLNQAKSLYTLIELSGYCRSYQLYLAKRIIRKMKKQGHSVQPEISILEQANKIVAVWKTPEQFKPNKVHTLLMEKYEKIGELNSIINCNKPLDKKAADVVIKFKESETIFNKRRDRWWETGAKLVTSAIVLLASLCFLGVPYYYLHQKFWRPKGATFNKQAKNLLNNSESSKGPRLN